MTGSYVRGPVPWVRFGAAILGGALIVTGIFLTTDLGRAAENSPTPKAQTDWPLERVTVIGRRGNIRDWLSDHTFIGTEGFADGSVPTDDGTRREFPWQVYYAPNGTLEAHFRHFGARTPHGPIEELDYVEVGEWRINDDGDLCQAIPKVAWGTEVCLWVDRRGDQMAMYYTTCGAYYRCYEGRLGPKGEIRVGRAFTR